MVEVCTYTDSLSNRHRVLDGLRYAIATIAIVSLLPTPLPRRRRVRVCRRHHLVPWEKFRLNSYFGCPARSSFRKNFPLLGQWVVKPQRVGMRHEFGVQFDSSQ